MATESRTQIATAAKVKIVHWHGCRKKRRADRYQAWIAVGVQNMNTTVSRVAAPPAARAPIIKIRGLAYARLRAPDLDLAEAFLRDFGMTRSARTTSAVYMRGTGPSHHIHVVELGSPGFVGFAYTVDDPDDLERIARAAGASGIEAIDEPGGGRRVRLREPNGFQIEIVHGIETLAELPVERYPQHATDDSMKPPTGMRVKFGPARIRRIAHGVLATPDVSGTVGWWREVLGVIPTDDLFAGSYDRLIGSFNRIDAGDQPVDHHVVFVLNNTVAGLHHLSFEVEDVEDIFFGKEHLDRVAKYEHMRGIGRHILGSQIYDYWLDPWNRMYEHWKSSERFTAASGSNRMLVGEGFVSQYGDPPSPRFVHHVTP
jgi:catechol 2,3-dioxygenase-like lactoylglutathione lyase family enzyme